jgi:hypothetical protein
LLAHHLTWHNCLFDMEDGEHKNALGKYDGDMKDVRDPFTHIHKLIDSSPDLIDANVVYTAVCTGA